MTASRQLSPQVAAVLIDPTVATGFIYTIGTGDPNFATVVLPTLQGSEPYTIAAPT